MYKKLLAVSIWLIMNSSPVFAGLYAGPTIYYDSYRATGITYQGFVPRLTLGYGDFIKDAFYLAGEVQAGAATINANNSPNSFTSLKTSSSYGASILPGYAFDDYVLGYVRIGGLQTHFSHPNIDTTHFGFQKGVGLQVKILDTWSARGEFDYVTYSAFSGLSSVSAFQYGVGIVHWFS